MAGMFLGHGDHGHSHANGAECQGHGPKDMPEEVRQKLLKQLEARMQELQARGHSHNHGPSTNSLEPDPLKTSYNPFLYGYGHEPLPPPTGWDGLVKVASSSPATDPVGGDGFGASREMTRDNFWSVNVPLFGRLRIVKDQQGWVMASCVVLYWIYGNWSTWNAILLPYYYDGTMSLFFLLSTNFHNACLFGKKSYMYVCACVNVCTFVCVSMLECFCLCVLVCMLMHVCMYILQVCVCTYVYMSVCV